MAVWWGLENAMLKPDMSPAEFAPQSPDPSSEWPAWGLWAQTSGQMGEDRPDLEAVKQLMALKDEWGKSADSPAREAAWEKILTLWSDQVFTIGIVSAR